MNERRRGGRWWRDFWFLTKPYFSSEEKTSALLLLAAITALTFAIVYVFVVFNSWNQKFYDSLQKLDAPAFPSLILQLGFIMAGFVLINTYKFYLTQLLEIRWRRWMTHQMLSQWLDGPTHYFFQLTQGKTDNPDQRIAEDIREFISISLRNFTELLYQSIMLFSFVAVLGRLDLSMLVVAFGYAVVSTAISHWIGKKLVRLNFEQQRYEADFRFHLVRVRENGESIALSRGADAERGFLNSKFKAVVQNFREIMSKQKNLTFFTVFYGQITNLFPILVASPKLFSGAIQLGGLMQVSNAFGKVVSALSFFVQSYSEIAHWRAVSQRLCTFSESVKRAKTLQELPTESKNSSLILNKVSLQLPDGRPLFDFENLVFNKGSKTLITAPSGKGKSTLLRFIHGLWPYGKGTKQYPKDFFENSVVVSQKQYLPEATLLACVSYPRAAMPEKDVIAALKEVGLETLLPNLNTVQNWQQILSGGEQQKLCFARLLLQKPTWVFLDEATSALDEDAQKKLYDFLAARLPESTVVSITHRESLRAFHETEVEL